jgi:hypothetical protein
MNKRGHVMAGAVAVVVMAACGGSGPAPVMVDVSVTAPRVTLAGTDLTRPITPADVEALRTHDDVVSVTPRARLLGAASGRGAFDGHEVSFELGGFTDGIPVELVADDAELAVAFVDVDPKAPPGAPVPVVVSPELIEAYNERYATARNLPRLDPAMLALVSRRKPITFTITLGTSLAAGDGASVLEVPATFVGVSTHAQPMGITVPIGHVLAWNRALGHAGTTYTSIDVRLRDVREVETFGRWLDEKLSLSAGPATVVAKRAP